MLCYCVKKTIELDKKTNISYLYEQNFILNKAVSVAFFYADNVHNIKMYYYYPLLIRRHKGSKAPNKSTQKNKQKRKTVTYSLK